MEKIKEYLSNAGPDRAFMVLLLAVVIMLCCYYILNNGGADDGTGAAIDAVGTEQQRALDSIDRIGAGLDGSIGTAESIGAGIERAQDAAGRVTESNNAAKNSITAAAGRIAEGEAIAGDSAERIKRCESLLEEIRSQTKTN